MHPSLYTTSKFIKRLLDLYSQYSRLLAGKFRQPSAPFNPELELCAGHQLWENSTDPARSLSNRIRYEFEPVVKERTKILKKVTKSGEIFYIEITRDRQGRT